MDLAAKLNRTYSLLSQPRLHKFVISKKRNHHPRAPSQHPMKPVGPVTYKLITKLALKVMDKHHVKDRNQQSRQPVDILATGKLLFVVVITGAKQGYEDFLRHVRDREVNLQNIEVFRNGPIQVL
ncbi:hypothetical protein GHT06_020729 [Daphnia sinensis]|uniref:Uncharacterized protein n=1 Tax=Daphnia sinensis TaxID=1820382 RepID=A0AAD5KJG6_9CRUS|nr:hypothetical protein GHT06_020729 [Daphnia sinensis]